jgi:hypothetical protein
VILGNNGLTHKMLSAHSIVVTRANTQMLLRLRATEFGCTAVPSWKTGGVDSWGEIPHK